MEVLTILEWLLAWGMLLFAQSVFINGVYQSATGETKKLVDGTDDDSEMILYPLKKFFEKMTSRSIQYKAGALTNLLKRIREKAGAINMYVFDTDTWVVYYEVGMSEDILKNWAPIIEENHGVTIKYFPDGAQFFKSHDYYKYSKWLRKPIIQCIKCMSSFWGSLTFWPIVLFIFGFHWLEIPIFFADMFSLTYLNWILYKRAQ